MAVKNQAHPSRQDPQPAVPHRRRRCPYPSRWSCHRDHRQSTTQGRAQPDRVDSERAQYWLGVGAQATDPVQAILKVTGDWQKFKGLPGAEGTLKTAAPKPSKLELFNAALAAADSAPVAEAVTPKKKAVRRTPTRLLRRPPPRPTRERCRRGRRRTPRSWHRRQPDDVRVDLVTGRRGRLVEVHVNPEDLGKVIGRNGRTATALRTLVAGIGGRGIRVDIVDTDR